MEIEEEKKNGNEEEKMEIEEKNKDDNEEGEKKEVKFSETPTRNVDFQGEKSVPDEGEEGGKRKIRDEMTINPEEAKIRTEKDYLRKIRLISGMRNKIRRTQEYAKLKREKKKEKKKRQEERKKEAEALGDDAPPKIVPKTIDSMREYDETTVRSVSASKEEGEEGAKAIDEETEWDITNDEFKEYFSKSYEPKVLITSGDNPHRRTIAFMKELSRIIPNSEPKWRKHCPIKKIVKDGMENGYTDIVIINENNRVPNGMIVTHLPEGPTAHFRLSNVKVTTEIRRNWREITSHRPEVILNNFTTRLGHAVGRMLAALFHYEPEFRGQRAVTFHNQRDYIFFRHHRYEFKNEEKVRLRELGPRFTLKLRSLQKGTFDSKFGEYEWIISGRRHEMETSRRKFFL